MLPRNKRVLESLVQSREFTRGKPDSPFESHNENSPSARISRAIPQLSRGIQILRIL